MQPTHCRPPWDTQQSKCLETLTAISHSSFMSVEYNHKKGGSSSNAFYFTFLVIYFYCILQKYWSTTNWKRNQRTGLPPWTVRRQTRCASRPRQTSWVRFYVGEIQWYPRVSRTPTSENTSEQKSLSVMTASIFDSPLCCILWVTSAYVGDGKQTTQKWIKSNVCHV